MLTCLFTSLSSYSQTGPIQQTTYCSTGTLSPSGGGDNPSYSSTTCWTELNGIPTVNQTRNNISGQNGGGGGQGQTVNVTVTAILDNPANGEPDASCSDSVGIRQNHAKGDLGPRIFSYRRGQYIRISYSNGETEIFVFVSQYSQIPATPIIGTCR